MGLHSVDPSALGPIFARLGHAYLVGLAAVGARHARFLRVQPSPEL